MPEAFKTGAGLAPMRRPDLNWLRAFAVIEVVISHSDLATKHVSPNLLRASGYAQISGIGVEVFFILSGYLICLNAPSYGEALAFLRSRILRILPLYLIFTGLVLCARLVNPNWVWNGYDLSLATLLRSGLILPQAWFPIVGVGWSLEHEVIFYALTALMMAGLGLACLAEKIWFGVGLVVLGWIGIGLGFHPSDGGWYEHVFSVLMIAFGLGWLFCCHEESRDGLALKVVAVLAACTVVLLAPASPVNLEKGLRIAGAAAFCLIVVGRRERIVQGGRADRWLAAIGAAAYSIYLSHWFVLSGLGKVSGQIWNRIPGRLPADADLALRVAAIALSLVVGLLVHAWLERPLDRWLRGGHSFRRAFASWPARPGLPGRWRRKPSIPS